MGGESDCDQNGEGAKTDRIVPLCHPYSKLMYGKWRSVGNITLTSTCVISVVQFLNPLSARIYYFS